MEQNLVVEHECLEAEECKCLEEEEEEDVCKAMEPARLSKGSILKDQNWGVVKYDTLECK